MNENVLVVKIETLTPLWTGGVDRKCDRLHETGIIGSLRWWYEAVIRGYGGTACDPSNSKCEGKTHCDVSELFGCTDWARKFRLEVDFNQVISKVWIGTRENRRGEYLKRKVSGFMSDDSIILKIIPLREISKNEWALLNETLKIIEDCGALGAHISQGNGVIRIVENNLSYQYERVDFSLLKKDGNGVNSPNLDEFFFYKFQLKFTDDLSNLIDKHVFWTHAPDDRGFKDNWNNWKELWNKSHFLPIAFHIRDTIRRLESDGNKRHNIFGELGKGSKVFVSHGYEIDEQTVMVKIFGYDVENYIKNKIKNNFKSKLKEKLFSGGNYYLESCTLKEEKTGEEILES
ncbi:hypothetical protein IPdc08_00743 [archaeon]|nr:hypothetical protein IPdc08_00743 [archaeon]